MWYTYKLYLAVLLSLSFVSNSLAGRSKTSGEITLEHNIIYKDNDFNYERDSSSGIFARLEYKYKTDGNLRWITRGYARSTPKFHDNDVIIIEEFYLDYRPWDSWIFKLGSQLFNWSATEAFHPADVLNARNFKGATDQEEKLGEPMLSIEKRIEDASIIVFYMPLLTAPIYPADSFLKDSPASSFSFGEHLFVSSDNEELDSDWDSQFGFNIQKLLGDADISLHYLNIYDRSTILLHHENGKVRPVSFKMQQIGGTYQQAFGGNLIKLELAHRLYKDEFNVTDPLTATTETTEISDNTQLAFGYEYGWNTDDGGEVTLLAEAMSVQGVTKAERQSNYVFQNDILFGYRFAFNDSMSKELLFTVIADIEREEEFIYSASYEQRINDTWKFRTGVRYVDAKQKETVPVGLERLDGVHAAFIKLTSHF